MIGFAKSVRAAVVPCTPELWHAAISSGTVKETCAEIEDALEKVRRGEMDRSEFDDLKTMLKKRLPIITPHATFRNGRRVVKDAVPSGLSLFDIDHIADPRTFYKNSVEPRLKELGIVLAHVTPSTEGLRLVFRLPQGMDLPEAQRWMAGQLGLKEFDACCKDLARCSFLVPEEYMLFADEKALFAKDAGTQAAQPTPAVAQKNKAKTVVKKAEKKAEEKNEVKQAETVSPSQPLAEAPSFKGIPYADIIREWFRLKGGTPVEGERNTKLFALASELRYITDDSEKLLMQVMPRFGLDGQEMLSIVRSALKEDYRHRMPKAIGDAVRAAEERMMKADDENDGDGENLPPEMPRKLPSLIALLTSRTPDVYRPAVAHAVFPALASHLWRTRFRYIDGEEHEATLMNVLMAGTGAGKSCIVKPINYILADIRRRDNENREREKAWKNEVNSKGSNKDKRQRPEGLVIQIVHPDMTNPAFVMRTQEAEGHFLYSMMNEIEQFDALRGSGRGGQQFQIMCLAFDPDNHYGQDRVGVQSVTEDVQIRFNWNASTTILKGQRYFSRVLTDGPISRINFCTIPEREIGAEMPVYGTYDAGFEEELRPYIENLTKATGLIACPEAERLIRKLKEECAEFARKSQSRVYENLSFRALVIAYLKACVLYVANGMKWEKPMDAFIRWSLKYDLWCKMFFFGQAIEAAEAEGRERLGRRGPRNLLSLLPDTFNRQQVIATRRAQGLDEQGTAVMLRVWKNRGYIEQTSNDEWRKK